MKNGIKFFGIIAIVAIIMVVIAACDTGGNDTDGSSKTATYSLDKHDERTFTLTVEGTKWLKGSWGSNLHEIFEPITLVFKDSLGNEYTHDYVGPPDWDPTVRTSDTVLTFSLKSGYASVTGTLSLKDNMPTSVFSVDDGQTMIHKANPNKKSITF